MLDAKRNILHHKKILAFLVICLCAWVGKISSSSQKLFAQTMYWESPVNITDSDSRFPQILTNNTDTYVLWEEVDTKNKQLYLTARKYNSLNSYEEKKRFAGPYTYSGDEVPDIYTAAINESGRIVIAVMSNMGQIEVFSSQDKMQNFTKTQIASSSQVMVAPRVYVTKNNTFKMFTSVGENDSFTIFTGDSTDGIKWSKFSQFAPVVTYRNPFIPVLIPTANGNIVVFQSQYIMVETNRSSYQLYMTNDFKGEWSNPVLVTDRNSFANRERKEFTAFQNQRPSLHNFKGDIYLAWERTDSYNSSIWVAQLNADGSGIIPGSAEALTSNGNASRPVFFEYDDKLCLDWFDTRRGKESIYMAQKNGSYWNELSLVENKNSNLFAYPLILNDEKNLNEDKILSFIWQEVSESANGNSKNSISIISPDKSVNPPTLQAVSYKKGKASRSNDVTIKINFPQDSSNIAGYSYTWGRENNAIPPNRIEHFTKENTLRLKATEDGIYKLNVRVQDYAGNWSEVSDIDYHLDLTPPVKPYISFNNIDEYGFIDSNNYRLEWRQSVSSDIAGYSYRIDYLGDIPKSLMVSKKHPMNLEESKIRELKENLESKYSENAQKQRKMQQTIMTKGLTTPRYYNMSNGVYVLSVSAIDEVGNVSESSNQLFILNKFQPSTYITSIEKSKNDVGDILLSINGGGFTYDGTITEIYIDKDGKSPYDQVLHKSENDYKVLSDRRISNINLGVDLEVGEYRIALVHSDRGLYFTGKILTVDQSGTVKIESDYEPVVNLNPSFKQYKYTIAISLIVVFIIFILVFALLVSLFFICINALKDTHLISQEIKALKTGAVMPLSLAKISLKRVPSLKKKLMAFTFTLVFVVVLVVSIQNGYNVVRLQEQTMAAGLQNRTDVLLESLHSGVKNFLPANNILELSALPDQKDAMSEVKFVTVIGQKQNDDSSEDLNYIWASNDSELSEKMDDYTLTYGESKLNDTEIIEITSKLSELDKQIAEECNSLSNQIVTLETQASELYNTGNADDEKEATRILEDVAQLRNQIDEKLSVYSKGAAGSYPYFDTENLDRTNTNYVFYRPVMYRKGATENYIHGLVYLELSTQSLIDSLNAEIRKIILFAVFVALGTVVAGIIGAYLFASLIVRPIKKLEKHVIMVGRTKNKALLKGKDVIIKSKDEVGRLGDAINNMTHELVANAEEEALAMDGKAVQKAFLPLVDSGVNNKNTFAEYLDNQLQCFGYYEGESGVSGDYFDYKRLDENWFGIIKCDASGHGIPAAIIMTVVATIFRRYFENWSYAKNGTHLNKLVEQINDFIEALGLKGKFATLIICLLNVKTGECYMCNAGDNLVHIYDSKSKSMKLLTLSSAPTAGVFTSDLVAMRGGFKVEKTVLNHGDVLFLYTDGIEESTRRIREIDYSIRQNEVEVKHMNPKTHQEEIEIKTEDAKEEFGPERIKEIIECVYNKKKYVLTKLDNPVVGENLEFDFTKCEGTVSEAIMALAALEKVFRLYKSPTVQQTDYIKIDKKIDEFLQKYFNMYDFYAAKKSDNAENGLNYIDYDQMQEDEQSDDLTLLAVKLL